MVSAWVEGRPIPKGRPRVGQNGQIYTPPRTRHWENQIGWAWRAQNPGIEPIEGPIGVQVSVYRGKRTGDLDNFVKAALDGLNGIAWLDDKQIVSIVAAFGDPTVRGEGLYISVDTRGGGF